MHFYRTKEKHVLNVMPISLIYMQRDALNVDMNLNNRQLLEVRISEIDKGRECGL